VRSAIDVGTTFRIELPLPEKTAVAQTPIEAQMLEKA